MLPAWAAAMSMPIRVCDWQSTRHLTPICRRLASRAIQRGSGSLDGVNYEEVRYEGYGISGAAIIVDCMTENRISTAAEVRHAFSKFGGNMGTEGSVALMFKHCGQLVFVPGTNEDALMEAALEAGAEDVIADNEGGIEVICGPHDFAALK